jgi:NMD protein affecting ribosome stability and mRNA decay
MEMEEIPELCTDCFLEHMIKVTVTIELHVTGKEEDSTPLRINYFFCPSCQKLKEEL